AIVAYRTQVWWWLRRDSLDVGSWAEVLPFGIREYDACRLPSGVCWLVCLGDVGLSVERQEPSTAIRIRVRRSQCSGFRAEGASSAARVGAGRRSTRR